MGWRRPPLVPIDAPRLDVVYIPDVDVLKRHERDVLRVYRLAMDLARSTDVTISQALRDVSDWVQEVTQPRLRSRISLPDRDLEALGSALFISGCLGAAIALAENKILGSKDGWADARALCALDMVANQGAAGDDDEPPALRRFTGLQMYSTVAGYFVGRLGPYSLVDIERQLDTDLSEGRGSAYGLDESPSDDTREGS